MLPRTKSEKVVAEISANLSSDAKTMQSVMDAATPHQWIWYAACKQKKMWCSDCGHVFATPKTMPKDNKIRCPHCGQILSPRWNYKTPRGYRTFEDFDYVIKAEVHGDWQLLRYFVVYYRLTAGEKYLPYKPNEVVRRWFKQGEKPIVESTGKRMFANRLSQPFALDRPISIKREGDGTGCYWGGVSYRIDTRLFTADSQWIKAWRRDGFRGASTLRRMKIEAYDAAEIFNNPHCVTLLKLGWTKLLGIFIRRNALHSIERYWPSIKVAIRRGYKTANDKADLWLDHLHLISNERFHKDLRNHVFVCPADLAAEHQRFVELNNREIERENRERERRRMVEQWETIREDGKLNEDYVKSHKAYLGLCIMCGDIEIRPLQSVQDFFEEGMKMHHCVFSCGYYKKHDALILSARLAGQRVETIEIDLKRGEIIQSRAVCNQTSEYHKQIVNTMKKEMGNIIALGKPTKKTKKQAVAA